MANDSTDGQRALFSDFIGRKALFVHLIGDIPGLLLWGFRLLLRLGLLFGLLLRETFLVDGVEHRVLLLVEIGRDGESQLGNPCQKIATGEDGLPCFCDGIGETAHGLFVIALDGGGQLQGLAKGVADGLFEIGGAPFHPFKELVLVQLVCWRLTDFQEPLLCDGHRLCLQTVEHSFVEFGDVRMAVVEEFRDQSQQVLLLI